MSMTSARGSGKASSYQLVETDSALSGLISRLAEGGRVRAAVDTEGESNLHRYGIRVSIVQIFDGERAYVVDALAVRNKSLLKALLEESSWIKVMFGASNDLLALRHSLDLKPKPMVDLALAAQLLGMPGGLRELIQPVHALTGSKSRFQKADWLRRPLPRDQLDYAVSDVLHLLELADELFEKLSRKDLMFSFLKRNWEQLDKERAWDPFSNFNRVPGFQRMGADGRRLAKTLWYAREYYARHRDLPPDNVASKAELGWLVSKGVRDARGIAEYLNARRHRLFIEPEGLAHWLVKAEKESAQ
jgi:ribonuclease D